MKTKTKINLIVFYLGREKKKIEGHIVDSFLESSGKMWGG